MTATASFDLEQLAIRESEQIEWKDNVADENDVVETLSAFANDLANLGGGYVICGASEIKDENGFPRLLKTGLSADRLKRVEGIILSRCRDRVYPAITPQTFELPSDDDDRRILLFVQPSTGDAHTFRRGDGGSKHFVRVGRSTIEARNGVLRNLLVRKGSLEPWDRRPCSHATVNDLDLLALRDALQRMRVFSSSVGVEHYLSDDTQISAFVPPLLAREPLTGILRPRNFALLLFGRETQRFIPGAVSLYSVYPGNDRSDIHAERHELAGTVFDQARKLTELLDFQSFTTFDKNDPRLPNAVKYPKRALYEAMGNALSHRDYELSDPTRITVFENRIEVLSPGSLPFGVDPVAFSEGSAGARWRNQTLAWFFNRLQIAQAEGQGIPTILRTMREEGCPPPGLQPQETQVICILPAHPRHALLREFREIEQSLALGQLETAQRLTLNLLDRDPSNSRALQLFAEIQTALKDPDLVVKILADREEIIDRLPPHVLLQLSEALIPADRHRTQYRPLSNRLLQIAAQGRLEQQELRRIAVGLLKNREERVVLSLIERNLKDHSDWIDSPLVLQLRGDAYLGLAKHCRQTAKKPNLAAATRSRIWKQFDDYLVSAESDLQRAETLSVDPGFTKIIQRNLAFLVELKKGRRPSGKRAHTLS